MRPKSIQLTRFLDSIFMEEEFYLEKLRLFVNDIIRSFLCNELQEAKLAGRKRVNWIDFGRIFEFHKVQLFLILRAQVFV